jgi:hypothetical protein
VLTSTEHYILYGKFSNPEPELRQNGMVPQHCYALLFIRLGSEMPEMLGDAGRSCEVLQLIDPNTGLKLKLNLN